MLDKNIWIDNKYFILLGVLSLIFLFLNSDDRIIKFLAGPGSTLTAIGLHLHEKNNNKKNRDAYHHQLELSMISLFNEVEKYYSEMDSITYKKIIGHTITYKPIDFYIPPFLAENNEENRKFLTIETITSLGKISELLKINSNYYRYDLELNKPGNSGNPELRHKLLPEQHKANIREIIELLKNIKD